MRAEAGFSGVGGVFCGTGRIEWKKPICCAWAAKTARLWGDLKKAGSLPLLVFLL